jgi:hypothetical protein
MFVDAPSTPRGAVNAAAEILHILRPVIFCAMTGILMRRRGRRRVPTGWMKSLLRRWSPWLISLAIDLLSARLSALACEEAKARVRRAHEGDSSELCQVPAHVANELSRRKMLWFLYVLRDPFFLKVTRRGTGAIDSTFGRIPVLGILVRYVLDMLYYLQRYYFYVSGS